MKKKIIGYIVVSTIGVHSAASESIGDELTLWVGGKATVFPTRTRALRTLARTLRYASARGFDWDWYETAKIVAVYSL